MNKFLSSLLASTMLLTTMGTSLAQENTQNTPNTEILQEIHTDTLSSENVYGDYYFYDGVITGYRGEGGDIVIPETINGQEVLRIDDSVFQNKNLTSVVLPDTLLQIGSNAFRSNGNLISMTIPASLQFAGSYWIYSTNLTVVHYKGDEYAWKDLNCGFTGTVNFGNETAKLTSALGTTMPSVPTVAPAADFYFYDGVITGYRGNGGDLVIPAVINGQEVIRIDDSAFQSKNITSVVLPDTLLQIGGNAFRSNALISVTMPASIQTIGSYAFYSTNLDMINYKGDSYAWKDLNIASLSNLYRLGNETALITSASESVAITPAAPTIASDFICTEGIITEYRGDGGDIVIPSTINGQTIWKIDASVFQSKKITSVVLPDTITEIGSNAFRSNSLVSVTIPTSLKTVGSYAFYSTNLDIVNYKGDEYQWKELNLNISNLVRLNVGTSLAHTVPITERNGTTTTPTAPTTPTPEVTTPTVTTPSESTSVIATPSTAKVMVNGAEVPFGAYNIGGYNYFKLTDIAFSVFGTSKQFNVGWDSTINAINIQLGKEHSLLGTELEPNSGRNEVADKFLSPVLLDGTPVSVVAYIIDGSSYFQLDTLKEIVGISVGWDNATSTITITA